MIVNGFDVQSSFIGGLFIGVAGHIMSKILLTSYSLYYSGIIPLVPGGTAYEAIKNLILNDYHEALITMIKVALISSSIALGLLIADLLSKVYYKFKKHRQLNKVK
ncbi:threonine/serine exporter family protein [Mammaliicoccus sciuri]|uniref:threonine/serine exporter family protein n=1 Tax=Mammaliicoccus sciuri TaxID=1296 RepID=UPI00397BC533